MHPATDPPTGGVDSCCPAPEKRGTYPENTLLSLLVITLFTTGVFYAVEWSLRERLVYAHQWDFAAMAEGEGPWTFPDKEQAKTATGMAFVIEGTGPGPALTMEFDAATVRKVRASIAVTRVEDGTPVPFVLEWYWSSPAQVAEAAGSWPFSTERGAAFVQPDRHNTELRQVDIHLHPQWKGPVGKAFIGVKLTSAMPGPFRVETKKIEFLE